MKKLTILFLVVLALSLSGCVLPDGDPTITPPYPAPVSASGSSSLQAVAGEVVELLCTNLQVNPVDSGVVQVRCLTVGEVPTETPTPEPLPTETPTPIVTITSTVGPSPTPGEVIQPYPSAPECPTVDPTAWHGIWDYERGCHYAYEHGKDPSGSSLWSDYLMLTNGQEISYPWMTPNELSAKGYGYKIDWQENLTCGGREGSAYGVSAFLIERHGVSDYQVAMSTPFHSFAGSVVICDVASGMNLGKLTVGGHQNFGQRTSGYQGAILNFNYESEMTLLGGYSEYDSAREPYFTVACINNNTDCRRALDNVSANSTWISEPQNLGGNHLLAYLFRVRGTANVLEADSRFGSISDLEFRYICSNDGGLTFDPGDDCRHNGSTGAVQEIVGTIPNEWDALDGVVDGFVTGEYRVNRWGQMTECSVIGVDCVPVLLEHVPVGRYGYTIANQPGFDGNVFDPAYLPSHDVFFCSGVPCAESDPGSVSSGWVGPKN